MTYQTTVTRKGQITIPKEFRDRLGLDRIRRVTVEMKPAGDGLQVKPALDFLEVARKIKIRRKLDPVKARAFMEKHYERA